MRHRRRAELNSRERALAVEAAARLHRHVRVDLASLQPSSSDYRALLVLCEAVNRCILELTGEDPEWMQVSCNRDQEPAEPVPCGAGVTESGNEGEQQVVLLQAARR